MSPSVSSNLVEQANPNRCRPRKAVGLGFVDLDIEKPLSRLCEWYLEDLPLSGFCRELHDGDYMVASYQTAVDHSGKRATAVGIV